ATSYFTVIHSVPTGGDAQVNIIMQRTTGPAPGPVPIPPPTNPTPPPNGAVITFGSGSGTLTTYSEAGYTGTATTPSWLFRRDSPLLVLPRLRGAGPVAAVFGRRDRLARWRSPHHRRRRAVPVPFRRRLFERHADPVRVHGPARRIDRLQRHRPAGQHLRQL